jgi:hypothetical protein
MKNLRINGFSRRTLCAVSVFVFIVCCHTIAFTQTVTPSTCFSISIVTTTSQCGGLYCGNDVPQLRCTDCYEITITSNLCAGLNPTSFTFSSNYDNNDDCRNLCSPSADFVVTPNNPNPGCSTYGPRTLTYTGIGGIGNGNSAKFVLCRKPNPPVGTTYTISCGCSCGMTTCTAATIAF